MKTGINKTLLIATMLTLPAWPLSAHQERYDPAERVVQDVLAFTLQRAADEILRVSRIDPVYQGYSRHYEIRHAPPRVDDRTRQLLDWATLRFARVDKQDQRELEARVLGRDPTPEENVIILDDYANTSSAGSIIAFHLRQHDMATGDIGLICSFGAGYSAGTVFVRKRG